MCVCVCVLGEIKVSPDGLLRQCSSMSDWVPAGFAGQPRSDAKVPGSYLELVERLPLPQYAHMKVRGRVSLHWGWALCACVCVCVCVYVSVCVCRCVCIYLKTVLRRP